MAPIATVYARSCPLCNNAHVRTHLVTPSFVIRNCPRCTNAWTDPAPNTINYEEEDFHSIATESGSQNPRSINSIEPQWRESILMQVKLLSRHLPAHASILEIGCGQGLLLQELANHGYNVTGIEPSATASATARKSGVNVLTGYFPQVSPSMHFDAVILSHVLEHLAEPLSILRDVQRVAAGGVALLVQTTWRGIVPFVYRRRWYAWVPHQHFWHFTPQGLQMMFMPLGWKTAEIEYSSLIHRENVLTRAARLVPPLLDQFHLLARLP